ncbi:hypothetical protein AAFN85_27980 [Mucilaginibacter sp. CAU 1740]|uniref:response regulator n=1 Tax=Mucilaginibacter sp. CAU 1740 TaxID=3140365 RepID=UPI00325A82CC
MTKTLLYIDDNHVDIAIIKAMQDRYPAFGSITYSTNAEQSISYIKQNLQNQEALPDVIFLDIYMAPFSGWHFLDEFNDMLPQIGKNIEIYIVSYSILPKDMHRSKQYDTVKSYFAKPVSKEAFMSFRVGSN